MGIVLLIAVLLAAVIAAGYLVGIYNQLVQVKVNVDKSWANIEVLEKQRYDEIPKLVKVCEGYMQYERETLQKVIEARSRFLQAKGPSDMAQASADIGGALKSLFALAEAYPDLKANQNFMQLQAQLKELEDSIESARRYYNAVVRDLNTAIEQFPSNLVASRFDFTQKDFFELKAPEVEREPIKVSF
jgi:LemA protein